MAGRRNKTLVPSNRDGDEQPQVERVRIKPPKFERIMLEIEGTAPLMIAAFGVKAAEQMRKQQEAGHAGRNKTDRPKKDFKALFEDAKHVSEDGWLGINASAFRNASISACRLARFKMTLAKLSIFVEPDGYEKNGTQLVRILGPAPKMSVMHARNSDGSIDLRSRPMWPKWGAKLRIKYDSEQFEREDVVNLIARVGEQVGIGEGRPDSKKSAGMGYGLFRIKEA